MGKVIDILKTKGNITLSVTPDTIVYDALALMGEKNVGALLVIENQKLVGIFSERDYARKVVLKGKTSLDTQVSEIMTEKVFIIYPEDTIERCMELMSEKRIRHLPVVQGEKVIGIISIGDVVKFIIEEQKSIIESLRLYMSGA